MIGSKMSGSKWLSQLIRQLWEIQYKMQKHYYDFLYIEKQGFYSIEKEAINDVIRKEYIIGRFQLPQEYEFLFQGTCSKVLGLNWRLKVKWLDIIWSMRDLAQKKLGLGVWNKDLIALGILFREEY